MEIKRGQRLPLVDFLQNNLSFQIELSIVGVPADFTCFALNTGGNLLRDEYMTFFNQPQTPCNGISVSFATHSATFSCDLNKLPSTIESLSFTAAIDGVETMNQMKSGYLKFLSNGREVACFKLNSTDFNSEKSLMIGDIYRKNGAWRFNAVGQGFNGGLSALLKHFGGEEDIEQKPVLQPKVPLSKALSLEKKLEKEAPQLLSLAKKLSVSLEKKHLQDVIARVALVMDASGSMKKSYRNGTVQSVMDRIVIIAARMDNDETLETWFYATTHEKSPDILIKNVEGYLKMCIENGLFPTDKRLGGRNNEPPVMQEIFERYKSSKLPVLIIFITDGGISEAKKIKQILTDSADYPIFWQFVGVAGSGYGVLQELDKMKGRSVDNAGFFSVDDLANIKDEELYDRLLSEFPIWLKEANKKGIVR
ncbi:MAG: VWA domain-containing protein [Methylococcaceae bacterium]